MDCNVIATGIVEAVQEVGPQASAGRAARGQQRRRRQGDPGPERPDHRHRRLDGRRGPEDRQTRRLRTPMSILVTPETKILVQGITGNFGARHAQLSLDYGTTGRRRRHPRQGRPVLRARRPRVPIFNTVADAMRATGATVSAIFVPPPFAADAILEGVDAGLDLVVAITEGIPVKRHGPREARHAGQADAAHRPELSRRRHARRGQGFVTAAAASASRPATSTRRATSASSPAAARSLTRRSGSSPPAASARAPASASAATRSTAPRTST